MGLEQVKGLVVHQQGSVQLCVRHTHRKAHRRFRLSQHDYARVAVDRELATTEEMLSELSRRFDLFAFVGIVEMDGTRDDTTRCFNGDLLKCAMAVEMLRGDIKDHYAEGQISEYEQEDEDDDE